MAKEPLKRAKLESFWNVALGKVYLCSPPSDRGYRQLSTPPVLGQRCCWVGMGWGRDKSDHGQLGRVHVSPVGYPQGGGARSGLSCFTLRDSLVAEKLSNWARSPWLAWAVSDGVSGMGAAQAAAPPWPSCPGHAAPQRPLLAPGRDPQWEAEDRASSHLPFLLPLPVGPPSLLAFKDVS